MRADWATTARRGPRDVPGDKEVLRLQVSMDHALVVRSRESHCDLGCVVESVFHAQRLSCHAIPESLAAEQFGDDVRPVLVLANVVHGNDVRVLEQGSGTRFLLEAAQCFLIPVAHSKHLDRHIAAQLFVAGGEDAAHATPAQLALDTIALGQRSSAIALDVLQRRFARNSPVARWLEHTAPSGVRCCRGGECQAFRTQTGRVCDSARGANESEFLATRRQTRAGPRRRLYSVDFDKCREDRRRLLREVPGGAAAPHQTAASSTNASDFERSAARLLLNARRRAPLWSWNGALPQGH